MFINLLFYNYIIIIYYYFIKNHMQEISHEEIINEFASFKTREANV
jgi:hypothetical protein